MAKLILLRQGLEAEEYDLSNQPMLTIGSDPGNSIVLSHPSVSAFHATLVEEPGGHTISDQGSELGVMVNGEAVAEQALQNGDRILLGQMEMLYRSQAARTAPVPRKSKSRAEKTESSGAWKKPVGIGAGLVVILACVGAFVSSVLSRPSESDNLAARLDLFLRQQRWDSARVNMDRDVGPWLVERGLDAEGLLADSIRVLEVGEGMQDVVDNMHQYPNFGGYDSPEAHLIAIVNANIDLIAQRAELYGTEEVLEEQIRRWRRLENDFDEMWKSMAALQRSAVSVDEREVEALPRAPKVYLRDRQIEFMNSTEQIVNQVIVMATEGLPPDKFREKLAEKAKLVEKLVGRAPRELEGKLRSVASAIRNFGQDKS